MNDTLPTNRSGVTTTKIVVAFLAIYLIWGTTFLGIRIAVETIPPFLMAGLRFGLAGGVLLIFAQVRGAHLPSPRQWRAALIAGGLMLAGGIGLLSFAEQWIPSGLAALVVTTIPIWITLFAWLLFKDKRPRAQTWVGLALGFAGALLLFAPALRGNARGDYLAGMAVVLIGAMLFAVGSLYSRRAPLPDDTLISTASEMLAGGILLLVISLLTGELAGFAPAAVSPQSLAALAYLVLFGSIIGYTAYLWLMKTVDPAKVSTNFYINPVVALIAGWWFAGEAVTAQMVIAAGVILFGVAVMNLRLPHLGMRRQRAVEMESPPRG